MAQSLLAHMYSHIKGSHEDIATYSLEYIVSQSDVLNKAFTDLLGSSLKIVLGEDIRYSCQSTGKQKERPDISGVDPDGKEMILCEAKFYAGLTDNQPNAYIDRLKEGQGRGLVFICPAARREVLWSKLKELCEHRALEDIDTYCAAVDGVCMSIITWGEVIDLLRRTALASETSALSDIDQLDGFCKLMDEEAFIPYSMEDFGPENARREERHYQVLDAVINHLLADKSLNASIKRLKATAYRKGYVRYIFVLNHALSINYDRVNWLDPNTEETPFWVEIMEGDFVQPSEYQKMFKRFKASWRGTINNGTALPLFALPGATLDEVAEDICDQIVRYIEVIDSKSEE